MKLSLSLHAAGKWEALGPGWYPTLLRGLLKTAPSVVIYQHITVFDNWLTSLSPLYLEVDGLMTGNKQPWNVICSHLRVI